MQELTEKQRRFVEAYVGPAKGNGSEAARMAGYKAKDAHAYSVVADRLLASVGIRRAVDDVLAKTRRASIADIVEIHETLTEVLRDSSVSAGDRTRAGVELAKMRGQYAPTRHEVEMTGQPVWLPDNGRDG